MPQDIIDITGNANDDTCALDAFKNAFCWGRNDQGQLGLGNKEVIYKPEQIRGITDGIVSLILGDLGGFAENSNNIWCKFGSRDLKPVLASVIPKGAKKKLLTIILDLKLALVIFFLKNYSV